MELVSKTLGLKRAMQRVDAIGDEERRTVLSLGEKVAHRPVHRPCHPNGAAFGGDNGERAIDRANRTRVTAEDDTPRAVQVKVEKAVGRRVEEVDHAADVTMHGRDCRPHVYVTQVDWRANAAEDLEETTFVSAPGFVLDS